MERETDLRVGAAGAVLHALHRTVVTKMGLSQKTKFSIYWSVFVPTLMVVWASDEDATRAPS